MHEYIQTVHTPLQREYHNVLIASQLNDLRGYLSKQRSDWELIVVIVVIDERCSVDTVLVKTDGVADASISVLKCMQPLPSALVD